jgi:chromosome segregation ATPase
VCQSNLEDAELRLQQAKGQEETLLRTVNEKKEEWMSKVDVMIKTIHKHFDKYFARIGCKGSVELQVGENGSYGILIKVSFRAGVAPQPLTASSQSGGEKSVSTMLYLLCLQEVTMSPFRMVDEINQGMDATNERRIFNQIVRSCEDVRSDDDGQRIEPPQSVEQEQRGAFNA